MKTALIVGPTGLIGKQLLELLLQDNYYNRVKAVSRKPLGIDHPKLETIILESLGKLAEHYDKLIANDVFCCLGTTMKQAGSKEAFKTVDFDYPLEVARITKGLGATQYLLVSALGANKNSSIYYNAVKGQVEEAVNGIEFESFHIFRPSLLLGNRSENRPGEDSAKVIYKIFGIFIPQRYKAIDSAKVARAMLVYAKQFKKGRFIHESGELQHF
jgi:uncharacterized protein YbjT (DUF2867 family)